MVIGGTGQKVKGAFLAAQWLRPPTAQQGDKGDPWWRNQDPSCFSTSPPPQKDVKNPPSYPPIFQCHNC